MVAKAEKGRAGGGDEIVYMRRRMNRYRTGTRYMYTHDDPRVSTDLFYGGFASPYK